MKSPASNFVSIVVLCIAMSGGSAHAAGSPSSQTLFQLFQRQSIVPLATLAAGPTPPGPESGGSKIIHVGPTANITAVANHIQVQAKSLNSLVTVASGLKLTKPVTISIAYLSPYATGSERKTAVYNASTGNSFLYSDPEADGKKRNVHMDITLSEPKDGGAVISDHLSLDVPLDPLYDVDVSPLVFKLTKGCSTVGANQIDLHWWAPDTPASGEYQTVHFSTKENETFSIREFSWTRREVSASAGLHQVVVWYEQLDALPFGFGPSLGPSTENLVPGKTHRSDGGPVASMGGNRDCQATLDYTVAYQLRAYLGAPTVRDHR